MPPTSPRAAVLAALALAALPLLVGCGGSTSAIASDGGATEGSVAAEASAGDGGGGDAGASVSADQAATDAAKVYCARAETCAPAYVQYGWGDVATCEAEFKAQILSSLGAPGTGTTPAQIETCVGVFPSESCADLLSGTQPAACQTMPGQYATGAACGIDSQCADTHCRIVPGNLCGTCAAKVGAGAACGVDGDCQSGMKCLNAACVAYGDEGAACSSTMPCRPDLGCVNGTCGAPQQAGTSCTDSTQCDQVHDVFCNPLTKMCETISFAQPGGMCGLVAGKLVVCAGPGGFCQGADVSPYVGTCIAHANDGAACDVDAGPLCDEISICAGGTCQVPDPTSCK